MITEGDGWSREREIEKFTELWQGRHHTGIDHSADAWDVRAREWDRALREDPERRQRSGQRVAATADFLRKRGLLGSSDTVADVGCGPGRFAVEFARTAGHVTGIDLAPEMARVGRSYAEASGVMNVTFEVCDFKEADPVERGWMKAFDLVFMSITPAVSRPEDLDRVEAMSRAWCFSSNFTYAFDALAQEAVDSLCPGQKVRGMWDSRTFYSMFNLLWLRGRSPECRYYREEGLERRPVDEDLIRHTVRTLPPELVTESFLRDVRWFYEDRAGADGCVEYPSVREYGWLLWDVRRCDARDYVAY